MKKLIASVVAVLLLAALAVPALANGWHMYVQEDNVKVYVDKDTESKVVKKLNAGDQVTIEEVSKNKKWYGIVYEKKGKQKIGWIQSKYLGDNPPQSRCKHEFGKWKTVNEPTCTQPGYRVRYCKKCGIMEEGEIAKLGHTYGAWKVTKEATCAVPGERMRKCKVCGHKQTEEIVEPHTYGEWTVRREATCTEEGLRVRKCKVCGHEQKKAIEKIPHSYGAWEIIEEATDHSSGVRARTCQMCGRTEKENYDPEGTLRRGDRGEAVREIQQLLADQNYLKGSTVDGIFGGGMEKSVMQFQKDQGLEPDGVVWPQTIKRLNHEFGPWQTVVMPTRATDGARVRVCQDCGYEQYEVIPAGKTIERGSRGEAVRGIQQMLGTMGYDAGKFDGIYGKLLDSAFGAFAKDHGLYFEPGKLLPIDLDALVGAWLSQQDPATLKGEGDLDSAVNLALTVNPEEGESVTDDMCTFTFSVTNLGAEKAMYNTVILKYGDPAAQGDVLVMDFDGIELKPNSQNSVTGSFSVASDWGEGDLNFIATAVTDSDGFKWLSNTVTFERGGSGAGVGVVEPRPVEIDLNNLADGVYPVSFNPGDVFNGASGMFMNAVHIYSRDEYDAAAIDLLAPGDTIMVSGAAIVVETVEREDDFVVVNGGYEEGGCALWIQDGSEVYVIVEDDDFATYTDHGATTLLVDTSALFTDSWDITKDPVTVDYEGLYEAIQNSGLDVFDAYNTTVRIEDGKVVEIERIYNP